MSLQILPYSVAKFNKIPSLADSDKEFQLRQGETSIMSAIRPIMFEHSLNDTFAVRVLHKNLDLGENEKLVELNDKITVWNFKDIEKLPGENMHATSWRVVKGQRAIPYEFKYRASKDWDLGLNLSTNWMQAFLRDFVDAVEAAGLQNSVSLVVRPDEEYGETDKFYGRREISVPEGSHVPEDRTVTWCFNRPDPPTASEQKATE